MRVALRTAALLGAVGMSHGAPNCSDYYASGEQAGSAAAEWCRGGGYFTFRSERNGGTELQLFWRCSGDPSHPAVVYSHGWPTSSYDLRHIEGLIGKERYVCTMDYPGFGFSDKPTAPFNYWLFDYADALHEMVVSHAKLGSFLFLTHDMGDSVGFIFLQQWEQRGRTPYHVTRHIVTNGGIYLPMTNVSSMQSSLLSNTTGPAEQKLISGKTLAGGMGRSMFTPQLTTAETATLASVFDYQGGTHVLHEDIQYLVQRHEFEVSWLEAWATFSVPCDIFWGDADPVCGPAVINYIWDKYLHNRTSAPTSLRIVPGANHYIPAGLGSQEIADSILKAP